MSLNQLNQEVYSSSDAQNIVQNIFCATKCYDLMQSSSKGTVFETTIPFQLAFFALVEHGNFLIFSEFRLLHKLSDTDVAPLWDPERRVFVGLMTVSDYVQALRLWRSQGLPTSELASRSIAEMFTASPLKFQHSSFQAVDAEDTVNQMCMLLLRSNNDYVPVVDPDNGNLVSILGYLDIIHLFTQIAKQHPTIFNSTIQVAMIGTYKNVLTAPKQSRLFEVLDAIDSQKVSAVPIVDEAGRVIGSYHKADVSFIIKAADPDIVMNNLSNYRAEDSLALREQLLLSGDIMSAFQGLVLCKLTDTINTVLTNMMMARSTRVVVVDDLQKCIGVISVRDIVQHYLKAGGGSAR